MVSVAPWDLRAEAVLVDAVLSTSTPERRLGNVEASFHQREQSWAVEQSAATERQEELEELLHRERATRTDLEQKLAHSMAALQDAERRESDLTSMLTEATATHDTLERRMADAEAALGAANERLSRERLVAVEQATEGQAALQAELEQEVEKRRNVEELLARAETARDDAEKLHASAMTIAATALAERQAQFETELSQTAATRDDLRQQLSDVEATLDGDLPDPGVTRRRGRATHATRGRAHLDAHRGRRDPPHPRTSNGRHRSGSRGSQRASVTRTTRGL